MADGNKNARASHLRFATGFEVLEFHSSDLVLVSIFLREDAPPQNNCSDPGGPAAKEMFW